jgi:hypothetical protein
MRRLVRLVVRSSIFVGAACLVLGPLAAGEPRAQEVESDVEVRVDDLQSMQVSVQPINDFVFKIEGRGARVVPWLQDFSLEVDYGPDEVRAQIEGARDAGIDEWLLWDPAVTYTSEALQRRP